MKTNTALLLLLGTILCTAVNAQTVNATYLNPQFIDTNYQFLRFGSPSDFKAGFMWNDSSTYYGNGDDFTIFTYGDRDIAMRPGNTGNFIVFPNSTGGNMGIGTANPQEKLELNGNLYLNSAAANDGIHWSQHHLTMGTRKGGYYHNVVMLKPGGASQGLLHTRLSLFDALSESEHVEKVRIRSNGHSYFTGGNVGIGTISPQEKLEVKGKIYLNSGGYDFLHWSRHNMTMGTKPGSYYHNKLMLKPGGASNGFLHSTLSLYDAPSENNHVEKIRIRSYGDTYFNGGNVAIGTTDPQGYKLAVAGKAIATEIKVKLQAAWPDYVFNETYELPTLKAVAEHITQKGHLPNIPSAAEVAEDGIYLGEMNAKLLEKIEELTLYTIAQEKEIKAQKEKIENQRKEIEALKMQEVRINQLENKLNKLLKQ